MALDAGVISLATSHFDGHDVGRPMVVEAAGVAVQIDSIDSQFGDPPSGMFAMVFEHKAADLVLAGASDSGKAGS